MRMELKVFRIRRKLSQAEAAEIGGVTKLTYMLIENGKSDGKMKFWENIQRGFGLTDEELKEAQKDDGEGSKAERNRSTSQERKDNKQQD